MSHCCTGPVHVLNGCLQWCETDYDVTSFGYCAFDSIANVSVGLTTCNPNFAGRPTIDGGLAASAVMLWMLLQTFV